jgi:Na+/melibiose symporter-like transporter
VKTGIGELLRRNAPFRSLWTARLLSFFGDSLGLIALTLYVYVHVRSGIAVALLLLVGDFLPGLISPLAGTAADRWDPKVVMVGCEIVQGALIAVIAVVLPPLPVLLLLVAVQSCVAAVFQPASRSCVPSLVADTDLERANAALGFGTNGMDGFTALAGAVLLTGLGVRWLLAADAATFAISAGLLLALPALVPAAQARRTGKRTGPFPAKSVTEMTRALARNARGMLAEARAGLGYIARDKVIRVVTIAFCTVVMFNAVDDVALVFLARHTLHGSNAAASLVYAGSGLGLLAGFLLLARTGQWLALPVLIVAGYAVSSLGNLLTGVLVRDRRRAGVPGDPRPRAGSDGHRAQHADPAQRAAGDARPGVQQRLRCGGRGGRAVLPARRTAARRDERPGNPGRGRNRRAAGGRGRCRPAPPCVARRQP